MHLTDPAGKPARRGPGPNRNGPWAWLRACVADASVRSCGQSEGVREPAVMSVDGYRPHMVVRPSANWRNDVSQSAGATELPAKSPGHRPGASLLSGPAPASRSTFPHSAPCGSCAALPRRPRLEALSRGVT